ncbi:MAG: heme exporter protein CcmB [Saprospiraceae bacterium]
MQIVRETILLIKKDLLLEWRQKYAIWGILLYVISTVFIIYISTGTVRTPVWNILYWIIILFASVNAVLKSFVQENSQRQLYYYQLAHPIAIILSKIIYNIGLLFLLTILTYLAMTIVFENPVRRVGLFWLILFLASVGFSITFTFVSAIASKADNSSTLMAILSFPIVISILGTLMTLSANALGIIQDTAYLDNIYTLLAIDGILLGLALILFPFLWKD